MEIKKNVFKLPVIVAAYDNSYGYYIYYTYILSIGGGRD